MSKHIYECPQCRLTKEIMVNDFIDDNRWEGRDKTFLGKNRSLQCHLYDAELLASYLMEENRQLKEEIALMKNASEKKDDSQCQNITHFDICNECAFSKIHNFITDIERKFGSDFIGFTLTNIDELHKRLRKIL